MAVMIVKVPPHCGHCAMSIEAKRKEPYAAFPSTWTHGDLHIGRITSDGAALITFAKAAGEVPVHPPETAGERLVEYLLRQEHETGEGGLGQGPGFNDVLWKLWTETHPRYQDRSVKVPEPLPPLRNGRVAARAGIAAPATKGNR